MQNFRVMVYNMLQTHSFSGLGSSLPGCGLIFFINDLAAKPAFYDPIGINGLGAGRKTFGGENES